MPSFKLYKSEKNVQIKDILKKNILDEIQSNSKDSETLKSFIQESKKNHKELTGHELINEANEAIIQYSMNRKIDFENDQIVWVKNNFKVIKHEQFLLIGKTQSKFEKIFEIYLKDQYQLSQVNFQNKDLWSFWRKLKTKCENQEIDLILHRIILQKAYLDSSLVDTLNIQAKNVEDVDSLPDLVNDSQKVMVVTFRVNLSSVNKSRWITIRIDRIWVHYGLC